MSPDALISNAAPVSPVHHGEITVQKTTTIPLNTEEKTTILLNIESTIKEIVNGIAKREDIDGFPVSPEQYPEVPNSITGVIVHYLVEGLKRDFAVEFDNPPKSLKIRGIGTNFDKKVAGKKRLLTRDQKNELIAKTSMTYYEEKIVSGEMTIDNVMHAIKDAFERKRNFEEMGYMLPPEKTKYPYWLGEEINDDDI